MTGGLFYAKQCRPMMQQLSKGKFLGLFGLGWTTLGLIWFSGSIRLDNKIYRTCVRMNAEAMSESQKINLMVLMRGQVEDN